MSRENIANKLNGTVMDKWTMCEVLIDFRDTMLKRSRGMELTEAVKEYLYVLK